MWRSSLPAWRSACAPVCAWAARNTPRAARRAYAAPAAGSERGPVAQFERLGLPPNLCTQLCRTLPHIATPTPAQEALVPAMLLPQDVVLRAHTGSGKSLGVLLALLAKPRLVFRAPQQQGARGSDAAHVPGISALVLVPTTELAQQYMRWARTLIPGSVVSQLDTVVQAAVRGEQTVQEAAARLRANPPHIVIGTPTRVQELLNEPNGARLLGLRTLRTLVLDEADAVLQLPGRFPSAKQRWKHEVHRAAGLDVLSRVMQLRPTYSGGDQHMSSGLEAHGARRGDERRPPERVRRTQYQGAELPTDLAPPRVRRPGETPLQLVCTSATANSVLRHFLGARTGWLRTNTRETRTTARWLDLTGLSGTISEADSVPGQGASALPHEIEHACVVVDAPPEHAAHAPMRNLHMGQVRSAPATERAVQPEEHVVDVPLLEALAFVFASHGVRRGLALVPARWSLARTQAVLEALGVPAHPLDGRTGEQRVVDEEPVLYLLQSTSVRGLDLPGLSHVFLVGLAAVRDAVHYTHVAGRVGRVDAAGHGGRAPGLVVTLLRGLGPDGQGHEPGVSLDAGSAPISSSERKMSLVYRRLGLRPQPLDLSPAELTPGTEAGGECGAGVDAAASEKPTEA